MDGVSKDTAKIANVFNWPATDPKADIEFSGYRPIADSQFIDASHFYEEKLSLGAKDKLEYSFVR